MKKTASLFSVPYLLWLLLFVVAPVLMLLYQSFFDISGNFTLDNYGTFFSSWTYLRMSFNSVLYAAIITLVTLLISYPTAYLLTRLKHKQLWLMLVTKVRKFPFLRWGYRRFFSLCPAPVPLYLLLVALNL